MTGVAKGHKNEKIVEILDRRTRAGTKEYRVRWQGGAEGWVLGRNLEYTHEQILDYERSATARLEHEEGESEEPEESAEDEELIDQRKTKKTTLQKELKNLASVGERRGSSVAP